MKTSELKKQPVFLIVSRFGGTGRKVAGRLLLISTGHKQAPIKAHINKHTYCTHALPCPLIAWCECLGSTAPLVGALRPGEGLAEEGAGLGGGVTSGGLFGRDCMAESLYGGTKDGGCCHHANRHWTPLVIVKDQSSHLVYMYVSQHMHKITKL